ncbi:DMT family transporter [Umezawaea sp.]|uniref:DMT family transporter n=1 Tax=Umezawaea sp. TaxID=1955258 RepID=UPI002ED222EC
MIVRSEQGQATALVAVLGATVLWGLAPVATRFLVQDADPMGLIAIRLAIGSACYLPLVPWMGLTEPRWTGRGLAAVTACAVVGIIAYNVSMTYGVQHVEAGLAGALLATEPLWIALLSVVVLKQELTRPLLWGFVVAFAGVVVLSVGGGIAFDPSMLLGAALVLLGAFLWGVYSVAVGPLVRRYGSFRISALTLWLGTAPLLVVFADEVAAAARALDVVGWFVLFLYGVGAHLIGMLLWNYGLSKVPGTRAGLVLNLYPVVSIVGGVVLLGEAVEPVALVGCAVVVLGLVLSQDNALSRAVVRRR